jgi:membrane-bound serine protease (ClpP class)
VIRAVAAVGMLGLLAVGGRVAIDDAPAKRHGAVAYSFEFSGPVIRGAQAELGRGLAEAKARRASVVILRLDTPGGLASVTREVSQDLIAAPMPVIVYVHPSGARANSAGLFLTLAADVAAMTPGTNIGSATPYRLDRPRNPEQGELLKVLERKARNDAIAWARSLAERHDRNANLAERMVSRSVNVPATTAKRERLIDVVATDERSLLRKLDGFRLKGPKARELETATLPITRADIEDDPTDPGASGDQSSFVGTLALIVAALLATWLAVTMPPRGRRLWRRQRRRWRAKRRQRQQRS